MARFALLLLGILTVVTALSVAVTLVARAPEEAPERGTNDAPRATAAERAEAALGEARRLAAEGRAGAALEVVRTALKTLQPEATDAWILLDLKALRSELAGAREMERFGERAREVREAFEAGRLGTAYRQARGLEKFGRIFLSDQSAPASARPEVRQALGDITQVREAIEAKMRAEAAEGRYLRENEWVSLAEYVPWRIRNLGSVEVRFQGRMSQVLHERMFNAMADILGAKSEAAANAVYYEDALPWRGIPVSMTEGLTALTITYKLGKEIEGIPPGGRAVAWGTFELSDPITGATLYYGWALAHPEDLARGPDTDAEALTVMVRDGVRGLIAGTRDSVVASRDGAWFAMIQTTDDPQGRLRREIALYLQSGPASLPEFPKVGQTKAFNFARLRLVNERDALRMWASGTEVGAYRIEGRTVTAVDLAPGDYRFLFQDPEGRLYATARSLVAGGTYEAVLYRRKTLEGDGVLGLKPARLTADYQEVVWEEGFPAFANLRREEATRRLLRLVQGGDDPAERLRALETVHRLLRQSPRNHDALGVLPRVAADKRAPTPVRILAVAILSEYRYSDFQRAWVAAHYRDFDRRLDEIIKEILVDPDTDPALKLQVKQILESAAAP